QLIDRNFVIAAHKYPQKQTFSRADIHDQQLRTLEGSVVVTCRGDFEVGGQRFQLRFLRVWRKTNGRWQVAAASVTGIA
ncbi:MAG: nuclear transport factor 2 family protein, partial [Bdellovibrionota bacterium]